MTKKKKVPPDDELLLGIPPEGTEGEEDLSKTALAQVNETVVSATDWTTETLLRQLERGNINLSPKFQRRDAWRQPRKSRFIESLFLGLPVPQLVLAENKTEKGSYLVIDGKQRLLSLKQFAAEANDPSYRQLKLTGLEARTDLNGMSLPDLERNSSFEKDVRVFQNQTIRTVVLKGWSSEDVLYLIFLRLNTGSLQLSTQELRQALHPGKFVEFADEKSAEIDGLKRILNTTEPDFRMRDAELLVRYYAFKNFVSGYRGNLKSFLDITCKVLNSEWDEREARIKAQADELERALETTFKIFGDYAFKKWDGSTYEKRFNRAVFDVMVYYFSQKRVRRAALQSRKRVQSAFRALCERNPDFQKSIETTTKSMEATTTRFQAWGKALRRRLRVPIAIPEVGTRQMGS